MQSPEWVRGVVPGGERERATNVVWQSRIFRGRERFACQWMSHYSCETTHVFPSQYCVTDSAEDVSNCMPSCPHFPLFRFAGIDVDSGEISTAQGFIDYTQIATGVTYRTGRSNKVLVNRAARPTHAWCTNKAFPCCPVNCFQSASTLN
jgi:hypothetical protein